MELQHLQEFVIAAGEKSFRQAAAKLDISPALLSRHIALLEERLGVRLFDRDAHHVKLTESGQIFLADAREIAKDYRQILDRLESITHHSYRSLKIGMTGIIIPALLGPYLDIVNLQHPDIHLEVLDDGRFGIADGLLSNAVDIFFSYAAEEFRPEGIEKELVYTSKVQVLVPQSHRLSNRSSISLGELDGERFVLYPATGDSTVRDLERQLLERSGISFTVYEETVCPTAYYIMVPVGKGLALCPWTLRDMIPPNTVALNVEDEDFMMSMYMFYRANNGNPYLPHFIRGFRSFVAGGSSL